MLCSIIQMYKQSEFENVWILRYLEKDEKQTEIKQAIQKSYVNSLIWILSNNIHFLNYFHYV